MSGIIVRDLNGYQKMIAADTGCPLEDVEEIEDIMRHDIFHSTLDWQTREQFKKGAQEAFEVLKYMRANPEPPELDAA